MRKIVGNAYYAIRKLPTEFQLTLNCPVFIRPLMVMKSIRPLADTAEIIFKPKRELVVGIIGVCPYLHITKLESTGLVECIMLADALSNNQYQINPDDYFFEDNVEKVIKPILKNIDSWMPHALVEIDGAYGFFLEKK